MKAMYKSFTKSSNKTADNNKQHFHHAQLSPQAQAIILRNDYSYFEKQLYKNPKSEFMSKLYRTEIIQPYLKDWLIRTLEIKILSGDIQKMQKIYECVKYLKTDIINDLLEICPVLSLAADSRKIAVLEKIIEWANSEDPSGKLLNWVLKPEYYELALKISLEHGFKTQNFDFAESLTNHILFNLTSKYSLKDKSGKIDKIFKEIEAVFCKQIRVVYITLKKQTKESDQYNNLVDIDHSLFNPKKNDIVKMMKADLSQAKEYSVTVTSVSHKEVELSSLGQVFKTVPVQIPEAYLLGDDSDSDYL